MRSNFKIWSIWDWEHWRPINGVLRNIGGWKDGNICTDEGLTHLIDVHFSGATQITTWYLCVFEDDYTPLVTDTYAIPGYTECETLQELTRPIWQEGGAAAKAISNVSNKASFTFSINKTIHGGSLVGGGSDPSVIGDTAGGGVLFCASKFTNGSQGFIAGDVAKLTVSMAVATG